MNRQLAFRSAMLVCLAAGGTALAEAKVPRIAIVNIAKVVDTHPMKDKIASLLKQRSAETRSIENKIADLKILINSGNASQANRNELNQLIKNLGIVNDKWDDRIRPLMEKVNSSVMSATSTFAKNNGVDLILDSSSPVVAQFIVYSNSNGMDITTKIIEMVK